MDCVRLLYDMGRRNIVYIDRVSKNRHFSTMDDWRYNGFITKMRECGLRIPEDVTIIGFNNSRLSHYSTPGLSSVELDKASIAKAIIESIEMMVAGEKPPVLYFKGSVVERKSTQMNG